MPTDDAAEMFEITLKTDAEGYFGRACPAPICRRYFKVADGTGRLQASHGYCAYCGHYAESHEFATPDQLEYASSLVENEKLPDVEHELQAIADDINGMDLGGLLRIRAEVHIEQDPVHEYREQELETTVICNACSLRYAIYGVFAFCPDCGVHNSKQILGANLDLAEKKLGLCGAAPADLVPSLIEDALKWQVKAFDGFGREVCRVRAMAVPSVDVSKVSFQNLGGARFNVREKLGFDFAVAVPRDDWEFAARCFQKRHVFDHRSGVVDQEYIDKTHDTTAVVGRKLALTMSEVQRLSGVLRTLGMALVAGPPPM